MTAAPSRDVTNAELLQLAERLRRVPTSSKAAAEQIEFLVRSARTRRGLAERGLARKGGRKT